ncbi:MAG: hypothetical protein HZA37_01170 [Parcubacteria group bacterium]|nr:hypothetical protein [Parcubacteria group bacterium]
METRKIGASNFNFTGARIDNLGATEYTLVTVAIDVTGSVSGFEGDLRQALIATVEACKKSPRSENLLLRVVMFSTAVGGVSELHGFKPLADIDPNDYAAFVPDGGTPLYDAMYSAVGATVVYGKDLWDNDYLVNGIVFVITDGADNASVATPVMIKKKIDSVKSGEKLESLITILVGVNAQMYQCALEEFRDNAGITQYIDAGDATKAKLAKLAAFVSRSVSSQSQALGTGGPSQNIQAVI